MMIGTELIGDIDADFILTLYLPEQSENAQSASQNLQKIAPGAIEFLKAPEHGQQLSFPRYQVYPPSFRGLTLFSENLFPYSRVKRSIER